jgi:hypothetical protein
VSLAAGIDGKLLFFCDSAQHALFAQQPTRHALPIGGLVTTQTDAGMRTALAKSAVSTKAVSDNRFTIG